MCFWFKVCCCLLWSISSIHPLLSSCHCSCQACNPPTLDHCHPLALSLSLQYFSSPASCCPCSPRTFRTPPGFISPLCLTSFRIPPHQLLHKVKFSYPVLQSPNLTLSPRSLHTGAVWTFPSPSPSMPGSSLTGLFLGSAGLCQTSLFLPWCVQMSWVPKAELGCSFVLLGQAYPTFPPHFQLMPHFILPQGPGTLTLSCQICGPMFSPSCFPPDAIPKCPFPHPRWSPLLLLWTSPLPHSKIPVFITLLHLQPHQALLFYWVTPISLQTFPMFFSVLSGSLAAIPHLHFLCL